MNNHYRILISPRRHRRRNKNVLQQRRQIDVSGPVDDFNNVADSLEKLAAIGKPTSPTAFTVKPGTAY
jgi:hypothetical protein